MIRMIWAEAHGGVIGVDDRIPWVLREDMQHFRDTTMGSTIVMGRRTWLSLGVHRPLPFRRSVVLTRHLTRTVPRVEMARTVDEVLIRFPDCWIIGGQQVYEAFMPYATEIVRTRIDLEVPGGTAFAPSLVEDDWLFMGPAVLAPPVPSGWVLTADPQGWRSSETGLRYTIERLHR